MCRIGDREPVAVDDDERRTITISMLEYQRLLNLVAELMRERDQARTEADRLWKLLHPELR